MLVSITDKCRMGCIHCMDDAKSSGNNFMDYDTWIKVLDFNFKYDKTIIITGAEPTEHPKFWEYLSIIAQQMTNDNTATITTNGMNMDKDDGTLKAGIEKINKLCKGTIIWQVTSDKRYYPIKIDVSNPIFQLPNFYIDTVPSISPVGRALTNHLEYDEKYTGMKCFNIRSIIRSEYIRSSNVSLKDSIYKLRSMLHFCTPQIAYDGHIKLGESLLCPNVAHIDDPEKDIIEKIVNFKCSGCEIDLSKLSPLHKIVIGEF